MNTYNAIGETITLSAVAFMMMLAVLFIFVAIPCIISHCEGTLK